MNRPLLMAHQQKAVDFLNSRHGGLLSLACGAGKTLITLYYLARNDYDALIVAPRSLAGSWLAENEKWRMLKEMTHMTGKERLETWGRIIGGERGVYLISYESLLRDYKQYPEIRQVVWDVVVGDESSKIKSPTAKLSKMFMLLKAERKVLLNATPVENSIGDLWTQCESVEPGCLYGNFYRFRAIHAVLNEYFPGVKYWRDKEKIIEKVKHVIFTIPKDEINALLPPLTEQIIPVEMTKEQMRVYKQVRDELLIEIRGETEPVGNALTKLMRLRQTTNGLWAFGGSDESGKIDALEELLAQFGEEKSLVFTQFAETAKALQRILRIRHVITGETTGRDEILEDWRENGTALVGTGALMKGHNLQDARYVVFLDLPFTFAMYEQAYSRAWRTGQKNPVNVYILQAEKTVDAKLRQLVMDKKEDGDLLTKLTLRDIENLII